MTTEVYERNLERSFSRSIGQRGGWAIKLSPQWVPGLPDRLVLHQGRAYFVELKTRGGRVSRLQAAVHRRLARHGFPVSVLYTRREMDEWIDEHISTARVSETSD